MEGESSRYFCDLSMDVDIAFVHNAQSEKDLISKNELDFYESTQSDFKRHFVCLVVPSHSGKTIGKRTYET